VYEVEVKIPATHDPVRERLEALDAEPLGAVRQHDTYYDHPTRDFAETDEALRLRRESSTGDGPEVAVLTYKGPLVDDRTKTREEQETEVEDREAAHAILQAVGFDAAAVVEKHRERYGIDGFVVTLDAVEGLGSYVEVEAGSAAADLEALSDRAFDLCRRLGLDPDESTRTSYLGLLLEQP